MKTFILLCVIAIVLADHECGENEHYESCGTACPLTCENYQNPPEACIMRCDTGCFCDEGYVKTEDKRCVKPEQCPDQDNRKKKFVTNVCSLPKDEGMCRGYFPRYYYDEQTGSCQRFIYGGCGGNENSFKNAEECQQICGSY